jgi:hypothetical protein
MTEFKINGQDWLIDDILNHLENGSIGIAIADKFEVERKDNTLYFKLKPDKDIDLSLLFWFGYHTKD